MLKIAFASTDLARVNLHFGAAERFVIYDVSPGEAEMVGVGEFMAAVMKGENKDRALPAGTVLVPGEEMRPSAEELQKPPEDKVLAKLEFLKDCAAIYASSIGNSSIKRLMAANIQPIIVDNGHDIVDLLNEVSLALANRGALPWVDRALNQQQRQQSPDRFAAIAAEGWKGGYVPEEKLSHQLITSVDELD